MGGACSCNETKINADAALIAIKFTLFYIQENISSRHCSTFYKGGIYVEVPNPLLHDCGPEEGDDYRPIRLTNDWD